MCRETIRLMYLFVMIQAYDLDYHVLMTNELCAFKMNNSREEYIYV